MPCVTVTVDSPDKGPGDGNGDGDGGLELTRGQIIAGAAIASVVAIAASKEKNRGR